MNELESLKSKRNNWLLAGNTEIKKEKNSFFSEIVQLERMILVLKDIEEIGKMKILSFKLKDNGELPIFKAGQYISITVKIADKYYTKPYSLLSFLSTDNDLVYKIVVDKDGEEIDKYLYDLKLGKMVVSSIPTGDFYYNRIRDAKNVIAIVSDKGIVPILAMVEALILGIESFNLTIFYSAKNEEEILFKERLDDLVNKTSRVKVYYVLTAEVKDGYLNGYVTLDRIKEQMVGISSIFISGSEGLLKYLDKELEGLELPKKFIRYESFLPKCNIRKVQEFNLTIFINSEKYETKCYNNKTILNSILNAGIYVPSKCQNGSCGLCLSELVKGKVKVINDKRDSVSKKYNYIHPCSTYPLSDIEIIVR